MPEFADGLPLPTPDMGKGPRLGKGGTQTVIDGPVADLAAVHFVAEAAAEFAGGEGVGVGFRTAGRNQCPVPEGLLFGRPLALVVAAGAARKPRGRGSRRACGELGGA